jgi:hypothetical protein
MMDAGRAPSKNSIDFGRRCREAGVHPSMVSVGDYYDNVTCKIFSATLECYLLRSPAVPDSGFDPHGRLHFPQGLLQSAVSLLSTRLPLADCA